MTALGLPRAERPEQVGLSAERLDRITATIRADVETGAIPGAVLAIARAGRIGYAEAIGYRDRDAGAAMQLDTIFRIASMTKPLTSLAAMMLGEEGRLDIGAPVAQYLPEFKELTVGVEHSKATRTMTVQDLLRHTSGLTYAAFGDSPVQMLWRDANLQSEDQTNEELVGKLGQLPLMSEPGTTWEYSMSTDVLGRVAEPLIDKATGKKPPMRNLTRENTWHSGGGGLASTASDYLRFCQMLLNGGELEGVRLVAPKTVAHMASDHLPPNVQYGDTARARFGALVPVPEMGYGFGLGFAVRKTQGLSPVPGSVGEFFWGGATGTYFWIDPQEQMIVVLMLQAPDMRLAYRYLTRRLVYAAVTERLHWRRR